MAEQRTRIDNIVDSARQSLAFAAPELQDLHWDNLKIALNNHFKETLASARRGLDESEHTYHLDSDEETKRL